MEPLQVLRGKSPAVGAGWSRAYDREDLDASRGLHLDSLLRSYPGFSTFRRSGSGIAHPTSQGVSLRGMGASGASRSLVFLDGIPMNDPFGDWVRWNRFSLGELESVRLGSSNAFGYTAPGIDLRSRKLSGDSVGSIGLSGGEVRGLAGEGFVGFSSPESPWQSRGSFKYEDFAGHPVIRSAQRGLVDEKVWSRMKSGRFSLERAFPSGSFTMSFAGFDEHRGNGTPLSRNRGDGMDWSLGWREDALHASVFGQERDFSSVFPMIADDRASESVILDQFSVPSSSLGFLAGDVWEAGEHEIGLSVLGRRREGRTHETHAFSGDRNAGGRQGYLGLSLSDEVGIAEDWSLIAIGKGSWFFDDEASRMGWKANNGALPDRKEFEFGGSLGLSGSMNESLSGWVKFRSEVRRPNLNELYRDYRVGDFSVAANSSLETERSTGGELGVSWNPMDDFSISCTLFHDVLLDSVANVSNPALGQENNATRRNVKESRSRGIEVSARYFLSDALSLRVAGIRSEVEILECPENSGIVGNRFPQVPENRIVSTLMWEPEPWELRLESFWESGRFDDLRNSRTLNGFHAINFSLSRKFAKDSRIILGVRNLFDEEIETRRSSDEVVYLGEPRNWFLSSVFSF